MTPGLTRGFKKGIRTVVQVAAGGALTALVTALAGGLAPSVQGIVMGAWIAFVAFSQNWAEGAGKIGVLLPTPALISGPTADAVATVEAVADKGGEIVGDVLDTAGDVVGEVTGQLDDERGALSLVVMIILAVLLMIGLLATCDLLINDESEDGDNHLLGRVELVSHDYDDGGGDQDYDQSYDSEDRNRNRDRNRGAFSPGPFDRSPIDFSGSCISLDCSGREDDKKEPREP